jgi:hypothetical protein
MRQQVNMGHPRIEVVDFSPEWDYAEGGAKVLVCLNPHSAVEQVLRQSALNEARFSVAFGLAEPVQVTFLQPGVLRCYAPKHEPGSVPLRLLFNGQPTSLVESSLRFEYRAREPVTQQKKRARIEGVGDNWLLSPEEESSREFKVRIVERLTVMERRLLGTSGEGAAHEEAAACDSAPAIDQELIQDE